MVMNLLWQKIFLLWLCDKCIHNNNKRTEKNIFCLNSCMIITLPLIHGCCSTKSHKPFPEVIFSTFFELCLNLWKVVKIGVIFYIVIKFSISPSMEVIVNLQCYHLSCPLRFISQQEPVHVWMFCLLKIQKYFGTSIRNSIATPWNTLLQDHKIFVFSTKNSELPEFITLFFRVLGYEVCLSAQNSGPTWRLLKLWIPVAWRYIICYPELAV